MKILLLLFLLASAVKTAVAQQTPQVSYYMYLQQLYNPSFTGDEDAIRASLLFRNQWTSLEGSPTSVILNVDMPVMVWGSGVGLQITNDMLGAERSTRAAVSFAKHLNLGKNRLGIGVSAGVYQYALDGSRLRAPDGVYLEGSPVHNDPTLPTEMATGLAPDVSLGVYFASKRFFAGLSSTRIIESTVSVSHSAGELKFQLSRNYFLTSGVAIPIGRNLTLKPSVLFKTDAKSLQAELSSLFVIKNNIYTGLAFRGYNNSSLDAVSVLAGFNVIKNMRVGYAYDLSLSELNKHNFGSHELIVNYRIPVKDPSKAGKIIYNPRFL